MAWAALEHRWQEARSGDGQKKEQDTRRESDKKTDFNATGEREEEDERREWKWFADCDWFLNRRRDWSGFGVQAWKKAPRGRRLWLQIAFFFYQDYSLKLSRQLNRCDMEHRCHEEGNAAHFWLCVLEMRQKKSIKNINDPWKLK